MIFLFFFIFINLFRCLLLEMIISFSKKIIFRSAFSFVLPQSCSATLIYFRCYMCLCGCCLLAFLNVAAYIPNISSTDRNFQIFLLQTVLWKTSLHSYLLLLGFLFLYFLLHDKFHTIPGKCMSVNFLIFSLHFNTTIYFNFGDSMGKCWIIILQFAFF